MRDIQPSPGRSADAGRIRITMRPHPARSATLAAGLALVIALILPVGAAQNQSGGPARDGCRLTGRALSSSRPLPGVSLVAMAAETIKGATSSDLDGSFSLVVPPASTYRVKAELTGFAPIDREVVVGPPPCDQKIELELT